MGGLGRGRRRPEDRRAAARAAWPILLAVLLVLPGLVLFAYGTTAYWGAPDHGHAGSVVVTPLTCPPAGPSPSSIAIPVANVPGTVGTGWALGAAYEFQVQNFSPALAGHTLYFPSAFAVFPTTTGPFAELFAPPLNATIENGSWSAPEAVRGTGVAATNLTFLNSSPAYLTTQHIAVMIDEPDTSTEIAVRWHWTLVPPVGGPLGPVNGSWSLPSAAALPHFDPSLLRPAPDAWIVSSSGGFVAAGTNWSATLNGSVAGQSFRISLEWANGTEVYSLFEQAGPFAATVNLTISTAPPGVGVLAPGSYILHIHNVCSAILHSVRVTVTTAAAREAADRSLVARRS